MADNLIPFSRTVEKNTGIDIALAKQYFIKEVLPYIGTDSLLRLIQENNIGNQHSVQTELMRLFIEAEVSRPSADQEPGKLNIFFNEFNSLIAGKSPEH